MNYLSKENVQELLEVSLLQESMISNEHVVQTAYALRGTIDEAVFQQAWDDLILRNDALRTLFPKLKNKTVEVVLKKWTIKVDVRDLRQLDPEQRERLTAEVAAEHGQAFSIGQEPLMRLALLVEEEQAVFLWTYNRLILDERSCDLLIADLAKAYAALSRGELPDLPNRRLFKEYLTWLAQQDWRHAKTYWKTQLDGFEAATPLLEVERATKSSIQKASQHCIVPSEIVSSLHELAERASVPSEAIVQAAWAVLLQAYSGEEAVRFGLTIHGRPQGFDGTAEMIGSFENTLPFSLAIDGDLRLLELLQNMQSEVEQLNEVAYIPLPTVSSYANLDEKTQLFTSNLSVLPALDTSACELAIEELHTQTAPALPLTLSVRLGQEWRIRCAYEPGLIADKTAEHMLAHFVTLLESMAAQPDARVRELEFLPQTERQQLVEEFNKWDLPVPQLDRLVHQVIEEQAASRPDALACVCGEERLSYATLNERANRLAHWLRAQGFGRNDLAGLLAERDEDMLVAILAVFKAGGAYVPLDVQHPDTRISSVLNNSQPKVIFTQAPFADRASALADEMPVRPAVFSLEELPEAREGVIDVSVLEKYRTDNPEFVNEPNDLAYVFFTSGSTGQPKGAMNEHIGMLNHIYAKIQVLGLHEQSVVAQTASHCFDISIWQFLAPLMVGGTVIIYPNEIAMDPQELFASMQRDRVTALEIVPTMIELVLNTASEKAAEERALPALKHIMSTGEGLPTALVNRWLDVFPQVAVVNAYGFTETSDDTNHAVILEPDRGTRPYAPLGRPIPNFKVYLLDRWNRYVPIGAAGEVCVTGIGVGRGYLNDPERTAKAFVPNPFQDGMGERMYRTGDLARYQPNGDLIFLGRIDHQVKVHGNRIELGEIEAALLQQQGMQQCIAIVRPDVSGDNRILAYAVGEDLDETVLKQQLQALVPVYMVPERIMILEVLPLNANGKVDRKALPEPDMLLEVKREYVAPRNELERVLCSIWEEVLGREPIGIEDNFFELGGHSLKTMQVRTRIKSQLGIELSLIALFECQRVAELAQLLTESGNDGNRSDSGTIPRVEERDEYQMSHAQRRLFFIQQMDPNNTSYNIPAVIELKGRLDVDALRGAFQTIVNRHDILRTTFHVRDDEPVQRVAPQLELEWPDVDLSALGEAERQAQLERLSQLELETPFSLSEGPIFRARLVKLAEDRHILWMNMHHIIGDLLSWDVLYAEFSLLYDSLRKKDVDSPLLPLPIQYADFAHWQNQRLERGELAESERYWLNHLAGELPVLSLPTDFPRPPVRRSNGHTLTKELSPNVAVRLQQLTAESDTTLFIVLLAACSSFLSRMSGQEDIIIGTPEAGRDQLELEGLIGFFINTLPLRIDLQGTPTFLELVERCKQIALDAYVHHEYPFDQLVDLLQLPRDMSRPALFSVLFQVVRNNVSRPLIDGLEVNVLPNKQATTKFDLTITLEETEDGLRCHFNYSTDLFAKSTIDRWMGHFFTMLEGIATAPEQPVATLPLLREEEKEWLLEQTRHLSDKRPAQCWHQLFEQQAALTPELLAMVCEEESITYGELNRRANQVAHYLRQRGVEVETVVGLHLERSIDLIVGMLGIVKAGGAYVVLDTAFPFERLAYIAEDARCQIVLTQQQLLGTLPLDHVDFICMDKDWAQIEKHSTLNTDAGVQLGNLAYLIYTSGTTGQPKGVMVEHRNVANYTMGILAVLELDQGASYANVSTLAADLGYTSLFPALCSGGVVHLISKDRATDSVLFAEYMDKHQIDVLKITPSHLAALMSLHPERVLPRKRLVVGGEALTWDLVAKIEQAAPALTVINHYGPSELTVGVLTNRLSKGESTGTNSVPLGRMIANTEGLVLDRSMQLVPQGIPGELYLSGDSLSRGYRNLDSLTAERYVQHPYRAGARLYKSGDLVRLLPDGKVEMLGRLDDQVKIRGFRVEPNEVTSVLLQHPQVKNALVLAHEITPGEKQLVAYVAFHEEGQTSTAALQQDLAAKLSNYLMPAAFIVLPDMPLNENGKVDRKRLPLPGELDLRGSQAYVPPRDRYEAEVVRIWEDVLKRHPIGVQENFFAMGGNSLSALVLMNELRARFGGELPVAMLFQNPTVTELCVAMREKASVTDIESSCLIRIKPGDGSRPPLFMVHSQGGGALVYFQLAHLLDAEETIIGVQSTGYETEEQGIETIEEMADNYVAEIRRLYPQGPYRLLGWSFGGTLAFEMARRFEQFGEQVDFLAILDSHTIGQADKAEFTYTEQDACTYYAIILGMEEHEIEEMNRSFELESALQKITEFGQKIGELPDGIPLDTMRSKMRDMVTNGNAISKYRFRGNVRADIQFFRCNEVSKTGHTLVDPADWAARTDGSVAVYPIPGDHNVICDSPHVEVLAESVREALQAISRAPKLHS
ncbi:MAG: amino acid adenylation domain-containing protein [Tumebacillaceae bacterium]